MQISRVHQHACLRVPALTGLFSDSLDVSSVSVVKDGTTTITTTSPHGLTIGSDYAVSIIDAPYPNPITAAEVLSDGTVKITTANDHDLTSAPPIAGYSAYNSNVTLRGFSAAALNGSLTLVSVTNRKLFHVKQSSSSNLTAGAITLTGNEQQLINLEFEIVGWHRVTAATATTLTFPTPSSVLRDYTADSVTAAMGMRIYGAESEETVMRKYVLQDAALVADQAVMFVVPRDSVSYRAAHQGQHSGSTSYNPTAEDGFDVIVVIPAADSSGGATPSDLAHGEILRAVLRTFNGLPLVNSVAYPCAISRNAEIVLHGRVRHEKAYYVHRYSFVAHIEMTADDRIKAFESAYLNVEPSDSVTTVHRDGLPAFRDIEMGIKINSEPGLMTINFNVDTENGE